MWLYNCEEFTEAQKGIEGFVYLITNTTNNRKYIGKKSFWSRRKTHKTGRRKTKESDWKTYYGSCDELKEDVKRLGGDKFIREILYLCPHKKSMSYYETYEQFKRDVLMTDEYYNTNIEGRFFVTERAGIYEVVIQNQELRDMRSEKLKKDNPSWRPEVKQKLSEMFSGEGNPRYGQKNTPEHTEKIRQATMKPITDGMRTWESGSAYRKEHGIGTSQYYTLLRKGHIWKLVDPE